MPGPAVVGIYVAATIGVAAASYTFYKFVYTPHIAPKFELWREEMKARRQARRDMREMRSSTGRGRQFATPHSSVHEGGSDEGGSLVELESFGSASVSRSSTLRGTGTQLRKRQPFGNEQEDTKTQMLDESITELSYAPLSPTPMPVQQVNINTAPGPKVARQGSTESNNNFIVGIETASPSPRRVPLPLHDDASPTRSTSMSPLIIQLPTPLSESPLSSSRSLSPSPYQQPHLHLQAHAPSMQDHSYSQSTTTSLLSFNTARSNTVSPTQTEFHSLSSPSPSPSNRDPGSPYSDAMSFSSVSVDEGLFSGDDMRSRSSDSLVRVDPSQHFAIADSTSDHEQTAAFIDVGEYGSDSGSDEGSDGSWQDVSEGRSAGATSPRI